ncbi:MAG: exosortase/archaeosortase family protein [Lacipirellulaceae bacterium]
MSNAFVDDQFSDHVPLSPEAETKAWIVFGGLVALISIAYWDMLLLTGSYWFDALYSHGWLIPVIGAFLFWRLRKPLTEVSAQERWIGVAAMVFFLAIRCFAAKFDINPVIRLSYVGVLLGAVMLVGGFKMFTWAGAAVAFLVFMFPFPSVMERKVLLGLQKVATIASTAVLQTFGIGAVRDGNRILIDELELGVVDACSGLRMLSVFVAMCVALAILMDRPWWDRLAVLVAAVPIALISNIVRIVLTAYLYKNFGMKNDTINVLIHDGAGFAMMFIGMGLLAVLFSVLTKLTVPIEEDYSGFGTAAG